MASVRQKRTGGGNHTELFALSSTGGNVSFATSLLSINQIISSTFSGHEQTKNLKLDLDHDLDSETLRGLFSTYLPAVGSADNTKYEDSSPGAVNTGDYTKLVGFLSYGGTSASKRVIKAGIGQLTGGDEKWEEGKAVKIKFGIEATVTEYPLVIATAKFNTGLISAGAITTISANTYGSTIFMTAA